MAVEVQRKTFWDALDERLGLASLDYLVPAYANTLFYSLGGLTLLGFLVLVVTGVIMTQFYNPSPEVANESVRALTEQVRFGGFVRNLHFWTAQVVAVTLGLHIARVVFSRSYKRPRELNWYVGVALFVVTLGLLFTGTVLKWDQEGYEALSHAQGAAAQLGERVEAWLLPGDSGPASPLSRVYSLHISVLPLLAGLLLSLHLLLVKVHGISPLPVGRPKARWLQPTPFRYHLRHLLALGVLLYGAAALASLLTEAPLGEIPIEGVEITKPPWFFWPLYAIENWVGLTGLIWAPAALLFGLVLLPLLDRGEERSITRRWWVTALLGVVIVFAIATVVYVGVTPQVSHLM